MYLRRGSRKNYVTCDIFRMSTDPCSLVLAACDEVRPVCGQLQVGHEVHVRTLVALNFVASLRVKQSHFSRFMAGNNKVRGRKRADDGFAACW